MKGNLLDYGNDGFGLRAMYGGHQSARTSVPFLVGQECIDLTAAQAGFVNAQMRAYVFGIDQVLRGMVQLFPPAEVGSGRFRQCSDAGLCFRDRQGTQRHGPVVPTGGSC